MFNIKNETENNPNRSLNRSISKEYFNTNFLEMIVEKGIITVM